MKNQTNAVKLLVIDHALIIQKVFYFVIQFIKSNYQSENS